MSYVSGFLVPVPNANKEAYIASIKKAWPIFKEYGAQHYVEAWGDQVPVGEFNDFRTAVHLKDDETVVFSWIVWADKETHAKWEASMDTDVRWRDMDMPFDGKRMIYGSFAPIFEATA